MSLEQKQEVKANHNEVEPLNNHSDVLPDSELSVLYRSNGTRLLSDFRSQISSDEKTEDPGGWTPMLILASVTCCLGSALPTGYNIGIMGNSADIMKDFCNQSVKERYGIEMSNNDLYLLWSTIVSIFLIGGVTGSLTASLLADKLGRRCALSIGNIFGIIGAVAFLLVPVLNSIELFLLGRLFVGLSGGLATSLLPTYLTEVAPIKLRGAVGVLCQLGITCGVLLGQIAGLASVLGTKSHWHYMLAIFSPLCVISLIFFYILPESPKFLFIVKEERERALKALGRFRNMETVLLQKEITYLEKELTNKSADNSWSIVRVCRERTLRLPLMLVCLLQFGQQLSGINAVFYYSNEIFKNAQLDNETSQYATIGTGIINVGMALISVPVMSCFGRKTLLNISVYSTIACQLLLCISLALIDNYDFMKWLCIVAVLAFVLVYGIGLGPIPYFIGSELFDVGPRSAAMAIGSVCNWGGNFVVGMTFTQMQKVFDSYSFLVFAGCMLFLVLFCRTYLPETRGKTTIEVAASITQGLRSRPNETISGINIT